MDLPPSYEEATGAVFYHPQWGTVPAVPTALEYADFIPDFSSNRVEDFLTLVARANEWLRHQPGVVVKQCESVLCFHSRPLGFSPDRSIFTQCKKEKGATEYLRYLRLWYSSGQPCSECQQIQHHNFTSSQPRGMVPDLFKSINELQTEGKVFHGHILNIETVQTARHLIKTPDENQWSDTAYKKAEYSLFIRVFVVKAVDTELAKLGFIDFAPKWVVGQVTQHPPVFQNFSMLMANVQQFVQSAQPSSIHILNLQSLYVKYKPAIPDYHQRLHYSYMTGMSLLGNYTHLQQIVRLYYLRTASRYTIPTSPQLNLTCKTFLPAQLTPTGHGKLQFETFSATCKRLHAWLRHSGATVLNIHCIPLRMYMHRMGIFSPETTLVWSQGPHDQYGDVEHWIYCIRVFLVGGYQEPSPSQLPPLPEVRSYWNHPPPSSFQLHPATDLYPSRSPSPIASDQPSSSR